MANCKLFLDHDIPLPAQTREAARQAALAHVQSLADWSGCLRTHPDVIVRLSAYRAYTAVSVWQRCLSAASNIGAIVTAARIARAHVDLLHAALAAWSSRPATAAVAV